MKNKQKLDIYIPIEIKYRLSSKARKYGILISKFLVLSGFNYEPSTNELKDLRNIYRIYKSGIIGNEIKVTKIETEEIIE